jgi:hypothetical protein
LDEFYENQIKQKFQSFEILKEKGYKSKDSCFKPFDKKEPMRSKFKSKSNQKIHIN